MQNIYLIPTDKPSRLFYNVGGVLLFTSYENYNGVNIYITNSEEIKFGDLVYSIRGFIGKFGEFENSYINECKKIILTTDQDLIKEFEQIDQNNPITKGSTALVYKQNVQSIPDDFLEWFVNNSSCEEVPIIPKLFGHPYIIWIEGLSFKEEPKQETLEEATERLQKDKYGIFISKDADVKGQLVIDTGKAAFSSGMNEGAKWMQERMYSEEDMIEFAEFVATYPDKNRNHKGEILHAKSKYDGAERTIDLLEQFKKK